MAIARIAALLVTALAAVSASAATASRIHVEFPAHVDRNARYVIYSHGLIAEGDDERPVSPDHGMFDLPAIRDALGRRGDFELIAPHRPKDADPKLYADRLEAGVRHLVAAGVKPSRITLVGFSRGAYITALASSHLTDLRINTAIIATCVAGFPAKEPMTMAGNVLSLYETSDDVQSCAALRDRSPDARFEEVMISTGLRHGAFYKPREAWVAPLLSWIGRTNR